MPICHYKCMDCNPEGQLIAGLDAHTAFCSGCGGRMLRLDEDLFKPYPHKEDSDDAIHGY